jgi:hypothetical protein
VAGINTDTRILGVDGELRGAVNPLNPIMPVQGTAGLSGAVVQQTVGGYVRDPNNPGNWLRLRGIGSGVKGGADASGFAGESGSQVGVGGGLGASGALVSLEGEATLSRALFGPGGIIPVPKDWIQRAAGGILGPERASTLANSTFEATIKSGVKAGDAGSPIDFKGSAAYDRVTGRAAVGAEGKIGEIFALPFAFSLSVGKMQDPASPLAPTAPKPKAFAPVAAAAAASVDMGPNLITVGVPTVLVGG